jgi:hypothetical protein
MIVRWSAWNVETDVDTRRPMPFGPEAADTLEEMGCRGSWTDGDAVLTDVLRRLEESSSCGDIELDDGDWYAIVWWHDDGKSECALRRLRATWSLEEEGI